jgi:hypothetical protein
LPSHEALVTLFTVLQALAITLTEVEPLDAVDEIVLPGVP